MRTPACFAEVRKYWNTETPLSKGLILTTLLLLMMAYLPTLQFDYVTQDQWRAFFRYSTLEQTPYERVKTCVETTWGHTNLNGLLSIILVGTSKHA